MMRGREREGREGKGRDWLQVLPRKGALVEGHCGPVERALNVWRSVSVSSLPGGVSASCSMNRRRTFVLRLREG